MKPSEYQVTIKTMLRSDISEPVDYCRVKLTIEVAEMVGKLIKSIVHNKEQDNRTIVLDEGGDILWYFVNLLTLEGMDFERYVEEQKPKIFPSFVMTLDRCKWMLRYSNLVIMATTALTGEYREMLEMFYSNFMNFVLYYQVDLDTLMNYNVDKLTNRLGGTTYDEHNFNYNR